MTSVRRSLVVVVSAAALLLLIYVFGPPDNPDAIELAASEPMPAGARRIETTTPSLSEFPVEDLRSTLSEVCSNEAADSTDKAWTQEETWAQDAINAQNLSLWQKAV